MAATNGEHPPTDRPQVVTLKLFGFTLTGPAAVVGLLALPAAVVALVVWLRPAFRWSPLWISAALWIFFIANWSAAARNAAPALRTESARSRQLHSMLLNAALVLCFWRVPGTGWSWSPGGSAIVASGLALHVGSLLLAVWARRHLGRNWSAEIARKVEHRLVRTGPYRSVRHPIYTAMFGMFAGTALVSGELHALIAFAIASLAYARKIRLEERVLRETFGAEYEAYRRESWALVPGLL